MNFHTMQSGMMIGASCRAALKTPEILNLPGLSHSLLERSRVLSKQQRLLLPHTCRTDWSSSSSSLPILTLVRHFSSHSFSPNLEFFSAGDQPINNKKGSLCVSSPDDTQQRPLTVLMCWLLSKDPHIRKYANFYNNLGVDVLKVRISPLELLRPVSGSQLVSGQMLEFLHQNPQHKSILVHGFSVGCYLFCEGLVQIEKDFAKHGALLDRFVGQIWDSGVDIYAIPDGVAKISSNKLVQKSIKRYLEWFLRAQYNQATVHYEHASKMLNEAFLAKPGLFLFSDNDSVSTPDMNAYVINNWAAKGIPVYSKCFEKSPHVGHFQRHRKAYEEEVLAFLRTIDFLLDQQKEAAEGQV